MKRIRTFKQTRSDIYLGNRRLILLVIGVFLTIGCVFFTTSRIYLLQQSSRNNFREIKKPLLGSGSLSLEEAVDYDQCDWLSTLLRENKHIGKPLPKSGTSRAGGMFWLKQPLLHTKNIFFTIPSFSYSKLSPQTQIKLKSLFANQIQADENVELIILKYNIYSKDPKWTQHTEKFNNTLSVLKKFNLEHNNKPIELFPKLYGYCKDLDGFHTIAVEYIDQEVTDLPKPRNLEECVKRADSLLDTFQTLDEDFHLTLVDFKKGQWMTRKTRAFHSSEVTSFVLQDIDDIVPSGSNNPYKEQISWFQRRLQNKHNLKQYEVDKYWQLNMFPKGQYSIRYNIIGLDVIFDNLGFSWKNDCSGYTDNFASCKQAIISWGQNLNEDYPDFDMVRTALGLCAASKGNSKIQQLPSNQIIELLKDKDDRLHQRKLAPWRMFDPLEDDGVNFVPKTMCKRDYDSSDKKKDSWVVKRCEHSCCRNKGSESCYYTVPMDICEGNH
eukprot:maker-scaffold_20-snap-gene-0.46-mRNA-1 protein AED:0.00 eAED:0.00 QI:20/1/1/1/1/1/4/22/495